MNFIALTDRFARQIEAWKNGHGFSDQEALKDLAVIFHEFINLPERKKVSYPGALGPIPLVDVTCGNCSTVRDMLTMCYNWRQHLVNEVTVDFQDVPKAIVETVDFKGVDSQEVKELKAADHKGHILLGIKDIPDARKYLDLSGIKYHHKMKLPALIKLIEKNG